MGLTSSKLLSDPNQFATPVSEAAAGFKPERKSWKAYDYIICGGGTLVWYSGWDYSADGSQGTAGCVLASRLSENPEISVLLIEAGKMWARFHSSTRFLKRFLCCSNKGNFLSRIPLAFTQLLPTAANWKYETVYNRSLHIPFHI